MNFLQPNRLLSLIGVAVLLIAYLLAQRQRKVYATRLASAEMLDSVVPKRTSWRRHANALVTALALSALCVAFAQPTRVVRVPRERATVIVAIDVSLSMGAADVDPTRLQAAQVAANRFIDELPPTLNVGIVSFAGTAAVLVSPTTDRQAAHRAIDGLKLAESTAIGEAIFTSLDALLNVPSDGSNELPPARIVLLSDGATTVGRSDLEAANKALEVEIPVSTIAFGTRDGFILYDDPATPQIEAEMIGVPVGGDSLQQIAGVTQGAFFSASSSLELDAVYSDIGSAIGYEDVDREITDWFVGGALGLLALGTALSLFWFQRMI